MVVGIHSSWIQKPSDSKNEGCCCVNEWPNWHHAVQTGLRTDCLYVSQVRNFIDDDRLTSTFFYTMRSNDTAFAIDW